MRCGKRVGFEFSRVAFAVKRGGVAVKLGKFDCERGASAVRRVAFARKPDTLEREFEAFAGKLGVSEGKRVAVAGASGGAHLPGGR